MTAKQHLSRLTTVHKDNGRFLRGTAGFFEELRVNLDSIRRSIHDFSRSHECLRWEICGDSFGANPFGWTSIDWHYTDNGRPLCCRTNECDAPSVARYHRSPLETNARCHHLRRCAI